MTAVVAETGLTSRNSLTVTDANAVLAWPSWSVAVSQMVFTLPAGTMLPALFRPFQVTFAATPLVIAPVMVLTTVSAEKDSSSVAVPSATSYRALIGAIVSVADVLSTACLSMPDESGAEGVMGRGLRCEQRDRWRSIVDDDMSTLGLLGIARPVGAVVTDRMRPCIHSRREDQPGKRERQRRDITGVVQVVNHGDMLLISSVAVE